MIRKNIVKHLRYGKAGLSTKLKSSLALQNRMIMDYKGDYLDAAMYSGCRSSQTEKFWIPKKFRYPGGWIARVDMYGIKKFFQCNSDFLPFSLNSKEE